MSDYCIGVDDHYALANLVSVAAIDAEERLLDKRRVELLDPSLPASPYHRDTRHMPLLKGEQLVRDVQTSADTRALSALSSVLADLAPATCRAIAIRVPPLERLPASVADAHATAWITNCADGMIYHHALTSAAARLRVSVFYFDKTTVLGQAAAARGTTAADLERRLKEFARTHGRPWSKPHIVACAGAILAQAALSTVT